MDVTIDVVVAANVDDETTVVDSMASDDDESDEQLVPIRTAMAIAHVLNFMMRLILAERELELRHMNSHSTWGQTVTLSPCQAKDLGLF